MVGARALFKLSVLSVLIGLTIGVVCSGDVSQEANDTLLAIGGEGLELMIDGACGGTYEQGQTVVITVTSPQEGYLYLFDFDADPDTASQFYPHPLWDTGGKLQAGVPLELRPEGADAEILMSSEPGQGLVFGIVVSETINPASVFTTEDIGGSWDIEADGVEALLAQGLAGLIAALPANAWHATATCGYTIVAAASSR